MAWTNQVAVVTGGARGIGRATSLLLARHGAAVCVNYATRADAAEEVVHEINRANGHAIAVGADVADPGAVASMFELAAAQLGPVTIVVNNAGIGYQATLDTYEPEKLQRMRAVNVDGIIHTTRAVMAGMRERRYGRIVNVASNAAIGTSLPGNAFYAASKGEVPILTRRMAMELGPHGITVNTVAPGFTRTDMTQRRRSEEEWAAVEKSLAERAMTRRIGEPDDIANAIVFLAAPESGWITAQMLVVDGGRMDYVGHG